MQSGSKKRRSCRGDEAVETGSPFLPLPDVAGYVLLHHWLKLLAILPAVPSSNFLSSQSSGRVPADVHDGELLLVAAQLHPDGITRFLPHQRGPERRLVGNDVLLGVAVPGAKNRVGRRMIIGGVSH